MTGEERAWLAGLMEGEGSFHYSEKPRKTGGVRFLFAVTVSMTDEDVIRRVGRLAGCGAVRGPYGPYSTDTRGNRLPQWRWTAWRRDEVRTISEELLPLMCERRQGQIRALLDAEARAPHRRPRRHGTLASYKTGCRCNDCKAANAAYARERRAQRRG